MSDACYTWTLGDFLTENIRFAETKMHSQHVIRGYWIIANDTPRIFTRSAPDHWTMFDAYVPEEVVPDKLRTFRGGHNIEKGFCEYLEQLLSQALMHVVARDG